MTYYVLKYYDIYKNIKRLATRTVPSAYIFKSAIINGKTARFVKKSCVVDPKWKKRRNQPARTKSGL